MTVTYIKLFVDYLDAIEPLGDAERGRLFTSLLEYAKTGEAPHLGGNERFIFPMMRAQIDRDMSAMDELSSTRSDAGKKGGRPKKQTEAKKANAFSESKKSKEEDKEEDKDKDKDIHSFVLSARERGENNSEEPDPGVDASNKERFALGRLKGTLGEGYVMLSKEQFDDLCNKLSIEELDKYIGIVRDCEKEGRHYKNKSHYRAILDMVAKDRKVTR